MWVRDALPSRLDTARVMLYGHDSRVANSNSVQGISTIAEAFRGALRVSMGGNKTRPVIFIGHSLGGLIIKQVCNVTYQTWLILNKECSLVEIVSHEVKSFGRRT